MIFPQKKRQIFRFTYWTDMEPKIIGNTTAPMPITVGARGVR